MYDVASQRSMWVGVLLGVAGTLGAQAGIGQATAGRPRAGSLDRDEFHDALDMMLDRHVDQVDGERMLAVGLKQMAATLDGHSHYLTAQERAAAQEAERLGADAGMVVALGPGPLGDGESQALEVVAVTPGGPAQAAGIEVGDLLLEVRGRSSASLVSDAEAQILLAGAPGDVVDLQLLRAGRTRGEGLELELAKPSSTGSVETRVVEREGRQIAVVALRSFRKGVADRLDEQLEELDRRSRGIDGIVLDLRGNPGGEVDEAILVADHFLSEGVVVRTRGRGGKILREERATEAGTDSRTPLIVLQDRSSASAAELLAAALQDHGRATIIGERSFGKGTVQERIGLADGSLLTLTIARYYSPDDRAIEGRGVDPDVAVADAATEAGLDAAIHWLSRG